MNSRVDRAFGADEMEVLTPGEIETHPPEDYAKAAADRVRSLFRSAGESVLAIGTVFIEVKQTLGHGGFTKWLREEFRWEPRRAQHYMTVARKLGDKPEIVFAFDVQ